MLRRHSPLVFGHHDIAPLLLVKVGGNALERVREHSIEFRVLGEQTIAINVGHNVEDQLLALQVSVSEGEGLVKARAL